jgi:hypothetical protein
MTPEALFHEMLGLGVQWRVTCCEFEVEEGLVRLWLEKTSQLWEAESIAVGQAVACYDHVEEVVCRHLRPNAIKIKYCTKIAITGRGSGWNVRPVLGKSLRARFWT